jgi:hypothetical protein
MFGIVEEYRSYSYAAFTSRFMCWNAVKILMSCHMLSKERLVLRAVLYHCETDVAVKQRRRLTVDEHRVLRRIIGHRRERKKLHNE